MSGRSKVLLANRQVDALFRRQMFALTVTFHGNPNP